MLLLRLFVEALFFLLATAVSGFFPSLERIISDEHLQKMSRMDIAAAASEANSLAASEPNNEHLFILCIDTKEIDLTTYVPILEATIGSTMTVLYIDSKVERIACYQTSSTLEILRTKTGDDVSYQRFPDELKIHRSVLDLALSNLATSVVYQNIQDLRGLNTSSNEEEIVPDYLVVHFSRSQQMYVEGRRTEDELMTLNGKILQNTLERPGSTLNARGSWSQLPKKNQKCSRMPKISSDDLNAIKAAFKINVNHFRSYPIGCFVSFVESLAAHPRVVRVAVETDPVIFNFEARGITQSNNPFVEPFSDAGLDGRGQIVGVADSGLNDLGCFFYDQTSGSPTPRNLVNANTNTRTLTRFPTRRTVIQYNYNRNTDMVDDQGGHGTHVVGSILGDCLNTNASRSNGMAPKSQVSFFDIGLSGRSSLSVMPSLTAILDTAYHSGARVHSNSWGGSASGYDSRMEELDRYQFNNPDFLTIFAAGNSGASGRGTIGSPAAAKNCLTVGAMTKRVEPNDQMISQSTIADFSSIGPTDDGRFGIDIAAPGDYIVSAYAGNPSTLNAAISAGRGDMQQRAVRTMSGTSMATPVVAGNALLLRQYFSNQSFWQSFCTKQDLFCRSFEPSASLLKSLLIHSATAVKRYSYPANDGATTVDSQFLGPPPDVFQGYGGVTLKNILPLQNNNGLPSELSLYIYDSLTLQSNVTYHFNVTISDEVLAKTLSLKATIAWIDPPFSSGQAGRRSLINDIDLAVVKPGGSYSQSLIYWGNNIAGSDHVNPVEQVYLNVTDPGVYTIYIRANNLVSTQNVSLTITYPTENVVTGPQSGRPIPASLVPFTSTPTAAPAPGNAPLPLNGQNFNQARFEYTLDHVVNCNAPSPLPSFRAVGDLMLASLSISNQPTTNTRALSVIVDAPNGLVAQIGSNGNSATNVYSDSNLYFKTWATATSSTRDLNGSDLSSIGSTGITWRTQLRLFGCSGSVTFRGSLSFYFSEKGGDTIDTPTQSTPSPTTPSPSPPPTSAKPSPLPSMKPPMSSVSPSAPTYYPTSYPTSVYFMTAKPTTYFGPSFPPTPAPTFLPGSRVVVSFNGSQIVDNYNSSRDLYYENSLQAFKDTVAHEDGGDYNITVFHAVPVVWTSRRLQQSATKESSSFVYGITFALGEGNTYSTASEGFASISNKISRSVAHLHFEEVLISNADARGSTALLNSTVRAPPSFSETVTSTETVPSSSLGDSSEDGAYEFLKIALPIVLIFVLIVSGIFIYRRVYARRLIITGAARTDNSTVAGFETTTNPMKPTVDAVVL